ncbi:MAG: DUF1997 domain-containing protein [Pseudanabaenaceae cyanobacterium bins.68]|nr:DUF1997 domain-containing protein [Pseudanabaenaceae cyanobacterium bins.68]
MTNPEPTKFHNHFVGYMDLYSDRASVMDYLDAHQGWFVRCAKPFKAEPLGENGYAMGVGRVGAFGFFVEPKVGLDLLPQDQGVYRIVTVPIPDQQDLGYEVDFQAKMELVEKPTPAEYSQISSLYTAVEWTLDLEVSLKFPQFILSMSREWIQNTGNGVLALVVKRVSKSLTAKVQADFHHSRQISLPKKLKH